MWKTVSARIRGASSELTEMGEDTDDMVESTSKLRSLVKGITGFDIMEDEDTFKDIYTIVVGIAEKWDTLSDIDQASLLEALAGKNQSNALAAALSNVDLLKKSYEEATNAEGSARKEQEEYAKSVQYSIDQAKASLEELENDFLSSDFLKGVIEAGNKLINILDTIISDGREIPTIAAAIVAGKSFKDNGIIKKDTVASWFTGMSSSVNSEIITPFANAEQVIYKYNQAIQHNSLTQQGWQRLIDQCDASLASYLTGIKGSTASMSAYTVSLQGGITGYTKITQAMKQYNALSAVSQEEQQNFATAVSLTNTKLGSYLTGLNGAKASLSGYGISLVASTAKTVGLTIATTALNAALTFGISAIVTGLITVFASWINSSQKITESAEEAKDKITSISDELETNTETVENVKQRYAELAQEIENLGNINQSRGSLSTDEYEEFLDLSNQLADVFPQLTKGYDDNGNAILDLSGNVDTIVGSLDDLLQKEKELTNQKIMDEFPDVYKGYVKDLSSAETEVKNAKTEFDKINNAYQQLQNGGIVQAFDLNGIGTFENENGDIVELNQKQYEQALKDLEIEYEKTAIKGVNQYGVDSVIGYMITAVDDVDTAFTSKLETARQDLEYAEQQLEAEKSSIDSYLNTWLQSEFTYNQIDDSGLQTAIQDMIMNFDFSNLPDNVDKNDWNEVSEYLRRNILFAINDVQDDPEISKAISEVFTNQDLTPEEKANYLQLIKDYFDNLYGEDNAISISLQPQIEDADALQKSYNNTINRFKTNITEDQTRQLEDARQNLQDEYQKISDWGLDDYADQIKNSTIQTKFGNVDMDKRTIIHWSNELKQTYADALASWDYDPEVGSIDTVFGGSERFGEDLDGNGWEIAFTPILPDGTFLSKDTVEEYINSILVEAYADDGKVTEDELVAIDAQGRQIGSTFVQGIFAGIDDSQNYDNNGNWAETVGRLMHFTGKFGAVQIAEDEISDLEKRFGIDGAKTIEDFFDTEGINDQDEIDYFNDVTKDAKTAEDAIKAYNEAKKTVNETPISFADAWADLDNLDSDSPYADVKEQLEELADAGQLTASAFKKVDGAEEYFEDIDLSVKELIKHINALADESTQLASMGDQVSKMSSALATKKEDGSVDYSTLSGFSDEIKDLDYWDAFQNALGSSTSSMKECQEAANNLATEWVNSNNFLANLTEENKDYYVTQLKTMGVSNALEVVNSRLANSEDTLASAQNEVAQYANTLTDEKKRTKVATIDLSNATASEIVELYNEATNAGTTTDALRLLAAQKYNVNNLVIASEADCRALSEIYKSSEATRASFLRLADAKSSYYTSAVGGSKQLGEYNDRIQELADEAEANALEGLVINPNPTNSTSPGGNTTDESASASDSKEEIDWIERKLSVLQTAIDLTKSKLENLFKVKSKSNNIQKQISQTKDLLDATRKAATRYKQEANKVKLSDELKKKVRNGDYDITEYSSEIANAINEYQEKYDNYKSMQQQVQELKQSIRELKQDKNQLYIDRADARQEMSEANQANKRVNNAKALNKSVEYQKKQVRQSYNHQIKNAKLDKDSVKVATLKAKKQEELRKLTLQEAENIQAAYDNRLKSNEATQDAIADALTLAETQGNVIGKAYYTGQIATTKKDLKERQKELTDLQNNQKSIKKYTQEWYDAQEKIDDVKAAIRQDEISIAEFQSSINELKWDRFDELINKIDDVTTEIDFLKNTLSDTLFDDKGMITDDGLTAMGLTLMSGNAAMSKRDYYKQQLAQLEKDYANGNGSIGYTTYIENQREYNQGLQDSISSIVEAKKATVDYVEQGLDAQNEALSEAIDRKKELIEEEKELKEWDEKLAESNKNIARMQRRLAIISQDTSEENQKTIRELKSELEDAQKEQDDDFYEKSIEDQEDALDQMLENAEQQAEDYLKNTEQVFSDATAYINANSQVVASNLTQISKTLGYDISTYITDAWNSGGNAIVNYSSTLTENVGGICTQISEIETAWDDVCTAADAAAKAMVNALKNNSTTTITSTIKTTVDDSVSNAAKKANAKTNLSETITSAIKGVKKGKVVTSAKKSSYATGGVVNGVIKSTGEDGIAFLRRGEAVLSQEQTKALLNFKTVLPQVDSLMGVLKDIPKDANVTHGQSVNIINNTTVEGVATDKIVKDFENVAAKQAENVVKRINNATYTKGVRR